MLRRVDMCDSTCVSATSPGHAGGKPSAVHQRQQGCTATLHAGRPKSVEGLIFFCCFFGSDALVFQRESTIPHVLDGSRAIFVGVPKKASRKVGG